MLASHVAGADQVLATPLLVQLPADASREAANESLLPMLGEMGLESQAVGFAFAQAQLLQAFGR